MHLKYPVIDNNYQLLLSIMFFLVFFYSFIWQILILFCKISYRDNFTFQKEKLIRLNSLQEINMRDWGPYDH